MIQYDTLRPKRCLFVTSNFSMSCNGYLYPSRTPFLICLAGRQFIIVSSFQILIIAHWCFFTSRASITKIQKLQERALRFGLKDSISDYDTSNGVNSFLISSLKTMAVEIYNILNGMNPEHLSPLFSRSTTPYSLRDNNKLIQPIKRTTTYGIKSLAYYGTHLWNLLPLDVKGAITLNNFKKLMRKWAGPTCGCSICDMVIKILNLPLHVSMRAWPLCPGTWTHALAHECTCLHVYMRVVYVNTCMYLLYVLPPLFIFYISLL